MPSALVEYFQSTGITGIAQSALAPLILAGLFLLVWRAVRLGRFLAICLVLALVALPWTLGAIAYVAGSHVAEEVARQVASSDTGLFRERVAENLQRLWYAPGGVTLAGAIAISLVWLRTRRR